MSGVAVSFYKKNWKYLAVLFKKHIFGIQKVSFSQGLTQKERKMKYLKKLALVIILFSVLTINCLLGQNIANKDFYYEYNGFEYKSILELKLDNNINENYEGVKCFSNVTDSLMVYFFDSRITVALNIKDSLLKTICKNSECNFIVNDKYNPEYTDYKYFTIEEGYNDVGFFHYALIETKSTSFLLIVVGNINLDIKTKSRIKTMFGYLLL